MKQILKYVGMLFFLILAITGYIQNNILVSTVSGVFFGYMVGLLNIKLKKPQYKQSKLKGAF